jgi:invasion protein IalB
MRKPVHLPVVIFAFACLLITPAITAQTIENSSNDSISLAKHKDWAVQCKKNSQGTLESCFMFQRILLKDSEESLLRMTVDKPEDLTEPRAVFAIPLGTYVTPGIKINIDGNEPLDLEIEYCDTKGCYAGILLEQSLLSRLKRGNQVAVSFQHRSRQTIKLPISLMGFSTGFAALN